MPLLTANHRFAFFLAIALLAFSAGDASAQTRSLHTKAN